MKTVITKVVPTHGDGKGLHMCRQRPHAVMIASLSHTAAHPVLSPAPTGHLREQEFLETKLGYRELGMAGRPVTLAALTLLLITTSDVLGQGDVTESPELSCYMCTYTSDIDDTDACVTDPDNAGAAPVKGCKLGADQCCFITRNDATDNLGTPLSLFRSCMENCEKDKLGKMIETPSATVTTYETYCNEHRCNNGPGNVNPGSGGGGGDYIAGIDGLDGGRRLEAPLLMLSLLAAGLTLRFLYL